MHRSNVFALSFLIVCLLLICNLPKASADEADEVDLSDVPLATIPSSGPANIMFLIDDSGSMDYEFMTPAVNGAWNGNSNNSYLFEDPGDNTYTRNDLKDMGAVMRWKSQWAKYNKMYYNPDVIYEPWPRAKEIADSSFDNRPHDDASWPVARSHPMHDDWTLDLTARFYYFEAGIIVDDEDSGYERLGTNSTWFVETEGAEDSGEVIEGGYEEGIVVDSDGNATGVTGASWTPDLPEARDYDVYVNWPAEDDNEVEVNYTVYHKNGNQTHGSFDHTSDSDGWKKLGTYEFDSGTSGYVELEIHNIYGSGNSIEFAADAVKFVPSGTTSVDIPRAHYYVWSESEGAPYLVVLDPDDDTINYYKATGTSVDSSLANNDDVIQHLTLDTTPPSDVQTSLSYSEAMDNFANWYSFYRRRELSSNAAVAEVIEEFSGVRVGIKSIHDRISQEVLPVHLNGTDESQSLLTALYGNEASGGTPLREALGDIGQYYDDTDANDGGLGTCPYVSQSEGGACQQSFSIAMTDGYWNGASPGIGNADDTSNLSYSFQDGEGHYLYSDNYSNTLADVAMHYYEKDLSSSLPDSVPQNPESVPTGHDPADWQHMITYTVAFGQTGTHDPDNFTLDVNASTDFPDWKDPTDVEDKERVDDLWHAAINGRGKFLSAENPNVLVLSLQEIVGNIEKRRGSSSSVSINGDELYQEIGSDIRLFQSSYNSATWTGDVQSYGINATTGDVYADPEWSAAKQLDDNSTWSNRAIASYNGTDGVEFALDSLNSTQKTHLNNNSTLVDYLKGDQSHEGGAYRSRSSILGDIVHSSPVFHEDVLYAGGNDGMLHAFNATTGKELFAYVPGMVVDDLAALAQTDYSHQYYVDLTPVVKKAPNMLNSDDKEESLLVGGLRKGGKGYYALDVTNAGSISNPADLAGRVEWEYTNATHLGYTYSRPSIVRSNDSTYKWIILFGNGYNSQQGHAELFILDTGGDVVKRIDTGYGYASGTEKNGLSTPTPVDVNNDQKVDYVYAGDLKGNMWKFDLTSNDYNDWEVAFRNATSNEPRPLFRAKNTNGTAQPITTRPDVMKHCREHGYMVLFGTGKHLAKSDNTDTAQQSVYGIWDYGDDSDDQEYLGTFERPGLSNQPNTVSLLQQEVNGTVNATGHELRITSDKAATWATTDDFDTGDMDNPSDSTSNHAGWYLDLPLSGEKVVTPVMIRDGNLIFVSHDPDVSPCSLGGYSFVHEVDACDGDRLASPAFDIDADRDIDHEDKVNFNGNDRVPSAKRYAGKLQPPAITRKPSGDEEVKYFSSSTGTIETMTEEAARMGVVFWKEMAE
jgi:type IV pilus assembly protein PilY1